MKQFALFVLALFTFTCVQAQRIVFSPQWLPQAQFTGYYVAKELGFYADEGLDVVIDHPSASYSAFDRMIDGNSHFITTQLPQALNMINGGFPLVNILQTSQHNSLLIIPRNNELDSLDDLRNRRVGIWKVGFGETAQILDKKHNLNIEWIPHLQGINLLISGAIDASLGMTYNEYWLMMASGIRPKHVYALADYGLDIPEDGLYVSRNFYEAHPEIAHAFARASRRGWEWTLENPDKALDIALEVMRKANVTINVHHQRWMLKEILQLSCDKEESKKRVKSRLKVEMKPIPKEKASFTLKPEQLELANQLLLEVGIIEQPIDYEQFWKGEVK